MNDRSLKPVSLFLWIVMVILSASIALYGFLFFTVDGLNPEFRARFENLPYSARLHIYPGALALLLGAFQFSSKIRHQYVQWHKYSGTVYLVCVLLSASGGFIIAFQSHGNLISTKTGFVSLSILWSFSAIMAYIGIKKQNVLNHQKWMLRNYALTLAAVSLRLELGVFQGVFGLSFDESYTLIAWLCWIPNLIIAEWFVVPRLVRPKERVG